ncbi:MAG: hypothetical protein AABW79_01165 [Nanoarchaeota archaeon]
MIIKSISNSISNKKNKIDYAEIPEDELKRKALERSAIKILLSPEKYKTKAKPRQIDTGLNEILARIAAKNNISIGINLDEIKNLNISEKAERLARIKQNIKICRKTSTKIALKSKSNNSKFLLLSLGSSTKQASEAQCF